MLLLRLLFWMCVATTFEMPSLICWSVWMSGVGAV